jgi:hypothetical protein
LSVRELGWCAAAEAAAAAAAAAATTTFNIFEQVSGYFEIWSGQPSLPVDRVSLGGRCRSACAHTAIIPRINEI